MHHSVFETLTFPHSLGYVRISITYLVRSNRQLFALYKSERFDLFTPQLGPLVDTGQPAVNETQWRQSRLTAESKWQGRLRCHLIEGKRQI